MKIIGQAVTLGGGMAAVIHVDCPAGSVLTCTNGKKSYTVTAVAGSHDFKVYTPGEWTVSAVSSEGSESKVVTVYGGMRVSVELAVVHIYGISRDTTSSSPAWTRTDEAVGKTAVASIGTEEGMSDFDNHMPWSGIKREYLKTGDSMVKIPKFYYRRYLVSTVEHIQIADKPTEGFSLHPLFNRPSGEKEYVYIGSYLTSSDTRSIAGAAPANNLTRAEFRTAASAKGEGWSLMDIAAVSAIQMLFLVEFASSDSQKSIGYGHAVSSNSTKLNAGMGDSVPRLTGTQGSSIDSNAQIVWRGIEGLWGNMWQIIDGLNTKNGQYYVCNDPSKYKDGSSTDYTKLSYSGSESWEKSYITVEGIDTGANSHIMMPSEAGSGSQSTFYCDVARFGSSEWTICKVGGENTDGRQAGLFTVSCINSSGYANSTSASRLMYIPV